MIRRLAALALWLLLALAAPGLAQQGAPTPDYQTWAAQAERVQQALDAETPIRDLEELRASVAERRQTFLRAQDINAARIETVQGQLDSLGAPPAEGESPESEQIAQRRQVLNDQLAELRAPVQDAEEAYTEADGLVAAIDRQIRDAYARQLLAREPSPLNPVYWTGALSALTDTGLALWDELTGNLQESDRRAAARDKLPLAAAVFLTGLVLCVRSSIWVWFLERWLFAKSRRGKGVLGFLLSLGQVVLPLVGVALMAHALRMTGVAGPLLRELAGSFIQIAFTLVAGLWLAAAMFPENRRGPLGLSAELNRRFRRVTRAISLVAALVFAIRAGAALTDREDIAVSVLLYLPRLALAFLLFRAGRLLMLVRRPAADLDESERDLTASVARLLGRVVIFAAVSGAILASAGYSNATEFLIVPAVATLALTAFVLILQRLVYDVYALVTGTPEGQTTALAPVLIGFALTLAAIPFYALIWGARVADLTEIWSRFRAGFTFGETRIAPTDFITFFLVFVIGVALTRFVQAALRHQILPKTRLDLGGRNAITAGLGYVGIFAAVLLAVSTAGIDLSSLALVAGALSVGIGFGLQNVVSNFVSGIILLIERPISEGDWISVNDQMGYVRDISVRSTRIETFDRTDVIVPNADLISGTVTNWTRGNNVGRVIVPVGVARRSDTRQVERILTEIAEAHPMVSLNPPPFIYFKGFGDSSLDFELRAILRDVNFVLNVQSDMNHEIVRRFAEEGIEIPVTRQDIRLRSFEPSPETRGERPAPARGGGGPRRGRPRAPERGDATAGSATEGDGR